MSDPMHELLDELTPDTARVSWSDPDAVRRRGQRRTRRQVAGSVVVGLAAVVAVAALAPNGLRQLTDRNSQVPAVSPTSSSGPSTIPSVSGSPSAGRPFDFLTPAQLPGPAASGAHWRVVGDQPTSPAAKCVDPASVGASAVVSQWFAITSNPKPADEIAVERLLTFDTLDEASAAAAALVTTAQACAYDADPVVTPSAGDEAKALYFRYDDGAVNAASMQSLVVVRVGARLAVLTVAVDGNGDIPYIDDLQKKMPTKLAEQLSGG